MNIRYISISGNTHVCSTFNNLFETTSAQRKKSYDYFQRNFGKFSVRSRNRTIFTFVPTYLDGGDGINNGNTEILTEVMREYLAFENNYRYCSGVVGSGNKNFNHQYCLTAKQYAEQFNFPFLADYELRGTQADIERIYAILKENQ